ncbi:eukaryotic translation initiation factor 4H-like [Centruroides vittatus]|uniref:eukaryotic translation initiation factor 4H-like n=1 Tax=Centruroides sculpturatus TaxID=218467 RepID=UPI000C6D317B|nr:eukaryotic translation initiation factor 4H-like [Centruroides sculpturatus]
MANRYGDYRYGNYYSRGHQIPNSPPFKAYVGNLPQNCGEDDFENIFVNLNIREIRMIRDRETNRFKGFGFVEFEDLESFRAALELNGSHYGGKNIRVDVATRRRDRGGFSNRGDRRYE